MKLNKYEIISLSSILEDIWDTNLISKKFLSNLTQSRLSIYSNPKKHKQSVLNAEQIKQLQETIPTNDLELTELIHKLRHDIVQYSYVDRMRFHLDSITLLALIKSGIRVGFQPDTYLYIANISIPKEPDLSPDIQLLLMSNLPDKWDLVDTKQEGSN